MLHRGHESQATKPTDCIKLCGQAAAAEYRSEIILNRDSENPLLPLDLIKQHKEREGERERNFVAGIIILHNFPTRVHVHQESRRIYVKVFFLCASK